MTAIRSNALALSTAIAFVCAALPAHAAKFDGTWILTAVTTRGHCGTIPVGMKIAGGNIRATGGSFAFNPIRLRGHVSPSGGATIQAVTGPRVANGTGRFRGTQGSGTWKGKGPSGLCSGVWNAVRS